MVLEQRAVKMIHVFLGSAISSKVSASAIHVCDALVENTKKMSISKQFQRPNVKATTLKQWKPNIIKFCTHFYWFILEGADGIFNVIFARILLHFKDKIENRKYLSLQTNKDMHAKRILDLPTIRGQNPSALRILKSCVQMQIQESSDSRRQPASIPHLADLQSGAPFSEDSSMINFKWKGRKECWKSMHLDILTTRTK